MHINLSNPAGNFPQQLSPLLSNINRSPYLSPLAEQAMRKCSYSNQELLDFQLEAEEEHSELQGEKMHNDNELLNNDFLLDDDHESRQFEEHLPESNSQRIDLGSLERDLAQRYCTHGPSENSCKDCMCQGSCDHPLRPSCNLIEAKGELYSTKFSEMREELQLPYLNLGASQSRVQLVVEYLVENIMKNEDILIEESRRLTEDSEQLQEAFMILLGKFKKLKKTKQEMTKYCMRKAFKFIADKMKRDRTHNRDVDSCMKIYFSKQPASHNFTIPFKKNSVEKTMNGNFLKRVFSSATFIEDYREFLDDFNKLMLEDNQKKVKYLTEIIEQYLTTKEIKKIETIKRLPWTKETLQQTESLGISLMSYADPNQTLTLRRDKNE